MRRTPSACSAGTTVPLPSVADPSEPASKRIAACCERIRWHDPSRTSIESMRSACVTPGASTWSGPFAPVRTMAPGRWLARDAILTRICASAAAKAPTAEPMGGESACSAGAALPATTSAAKSGDRAIVTGIAHSASCPKCVTVIGAVALHAATDALAAGIALRRRTHVMPSPEHTRIRARSSGRDARMSPMTAAKLSWKPGLAA